MINKLVICFARVAFKYILKIEKMLQFGAKSSQEVKRPIILLSTMAVSSLTALGLA